MQRDLFRTIDFRAGAYDPSNRQACDDLARHSALPRRQRGPPQSVDRRHPDQLCGLPSRRRGADRQRQPRSAFPEQPCETRRHIRRPVVHAVRRRGGAGASPGLVLGYTSDPAEHRTPDQPPEHRQSGSPVAIGPPRTRRRARGRGVEENINSGMLPGGTYVRRWVWQSAHCATEPISRLATARSGS